MSEAEAVAVVLLVGAMMYAVFGGADFGAGLWQLLARRAGELGERVTHRIDASLTPRLGGQPRLADLHPRRALDRRSPRRSRRS